MEKAASPGTCTSRSAWLASMTVIIRKTVCPHDCPDTCSILASVEDGRVTACEGDPARRFIPGRLCHSVVCATAAPGT